MVLFELDVTLMKSSMVFIYIQINGLGTKNSIILESLFIYCCENQRYALEKNLKQFLDDVIVFFFLKLQFF
jgi:hypothetical protein